MLKLNLGCGHRLFPKEDGWINVDFRNELADVEADVRDLPFKDGEAETIAAYHIIEHFTQEQVQVLIQEWNRVLKIDGLLDLEFPDFTRLAQLYLEQPEFEGTRDYQDSIIALIIGRHDTVGAGHFWAWSQYSMIKFLEDNGFKVTNAGTPHAHQNFPGGAERGFCKITAIKVKEIPGKPTRTKIIANIVEKPKKKRKVRAKSKSGVSRTKARKAVKKVIKKSKDKLKFMEPQNGQYDG